MHNFVSVLLEPQWALSTEALNEQFYQLSLSGPAHCSEPKPDTFQGVWQSLWQTHWNEINAPKGKCRSTDTAPSQPLRLCPLALPHAGREPPQAHLLRVTFHFSALQDALAAPHGTATHSTRHSLAWRSLCPTLPLPYAQVCPSELVGHPCVRSSNLKLLRPFVT